MRVNSLADLTILKSHFGRWIICLTAAKGWAWGTTGSRFVEHRDGASARGADGQVANFETEQEAINYAIQNVVAPPKKEKA